MFINLLVTDAVKGRVRYCSTIIAFVRVGRPCLGAIRVRFGSHVRVAPRRAEQP